jgi:putative transposase
MSNLRFQTGEYYHIYNRGVDKRQIFVSNSDYIRFITVLREFNDPAPIGSLYLRRYLDAKKCNPKPYRASDCLVEIIAYCLCFNHYHLILKQIAENGISKFMQKVGLGYTNFINRKYKRTGGLYGGKFKSVHISSNSNLLRLSSYVNCNSEIHMIADAENWVWSSYQDYIGKRNGNLCAKEIILNQFKNIAEYISLSKSVISESQSLKTDIKKYFLE